MGTVFISKILEDLIPFFLQKRRLDLALIKEKICNADREGIKYLAHCIKGTAGSYGFDELSAMAGDLESRAGAEPLPVLEALCGLLERHLDEAEIVYTDDQGEREPG